MKKGIIFDVDGTLWDSAKPVAESWTLMLERRYPELARIITSDDMYRNMGKTMDAIGADLFPGLAPDKRDEVMDACMRYLADHPGVTYPNMKETLAALSREYGLYIVSNCHKGYIEALMAACGIASYISDTECFGATGRPKGDNIRLVMERNGLEKCLYVGDTAMDQEAAGKAGIPFVFAAYGFGQASGAEAVIGSLAELPQAVKEILE